MSKLDPAVEIPKLTDKHRIVYRHWGAPDSVESGLFVDGIGYLVTMAGDTVRYSNGNTPHLWSGSNPVFILEAVIPPALVPYKGMQLVSRMGTLWTYWPSKGADWVSPSGDRETTEYIEECWHIGKLTHFTPEVPA